MLALNFFIALNLISGSAAGILTNLVVQLQLNYFTVFALAFTCFIAVSGVIVFAWLYFIVFVCILFFTLRRGGLLWLSRAALPFFVCYDSTNPLELYSFNDIFFMLFALQIFLLGLIGLCMSYKNLFLFLIVMELVYLGISLLFLSFSIYWFYDLRGLLYGFTVMVLAAAEAALGLSLIIRAKELGTPVELFYSEKPDKVNSVLFITLAVVSNLNPYFGWLRFFLVIFFVFTLIVFLLQFLFKNVHVTSLQKASVYECGFESFGDARSKFQVSFYVIALLYLIFDIELVFLFPWALAASVIGFWGHLVFLFFLSVLLLGLVYEHLIGALDFDPLL